MFSTFSQNPNSLGKGDANWWMHPKPSLSLPNEEQGLTVEEASKRLLEFGPNALRPQAKHAILWQFLSRFKNPLVLVLLIASAVSAFTGEMTNFAIISVIVMLSVTLDFVQEFRANAAADKLRQSVALNTSVWREGGCRSIPVDQVVPGDLILLTAGDLVPADGWVIQAKDCFVNQSLLTGEAFPVEKHTQLLLPAAGDIQEATHALFMGSSVIGGSAKMQVVNTGMQTAMGHIAQSMTQPATATSFEQGARRFGMLIMWLTVVLVLFVLLVNAWFHKPWLESFLFAVALAVGLTPELLPMVVSITLARGALRLAQLKMIVKRQSAIQDLGSMDVFCTDKTGTLTEARIHLDSYTDLEGNQSDHVLHLAYLNSYFETGLKSPLDEAILSQVVLDISDWKKIDEIPFDFERRCVSVLIDDGQRRWLVVKGAAEEVVRLCTQVCPGPIDSEIEPINEIKAERIRQQYHAMEAQGLRVLAIAWRAVPVQQTAALMKDESELILAGFAAFLDPPKASAAPALAQLQKTGVSIKVVTGDSDLVTQHVCAQLGIAIEGVMLGKEIALLDEAALQRRVEKANIFCRVNPSQKQQVIRALKANGHVVGYMGDGINDAPSLRAADVGLSVDTAVDVAKAAADIILLEQDLGVVHAGVMEGRRTFGNIMKYILMGTSSNFGNMFSMAGAALFLPFLPMLPTQILLNNILYDLSEIPIPLDDVDEREMARPRILDLSFIRNFMLVIGPISSLFDFLTFYVLWVVIQANEVLFQTGWFVESLCTQVLVIFVIRTQGNPFKSRPHKVLAFTSLFIVLMAILLPLTPLGAYFGFVAPPWNFYIILMAMTFMYLVCVQVAKSLFYRWVFKR